MFAAASYLTAFPSDKKQLGQIMSTNINNKHILKSWQI
ncbi:hypothetical protein HMPREF9296_1243 [Prevotella disiens FB035-09AN]|uniref:Uncharacterized protein n=1 Tax=Prevotella disiens FB035-09AN TaxID=866771 RepID=E1KPI4_9BACT|nr:hypothetical protein HMPREF9296_1243 [Prevotella disiens FB035-09AN]